MSTLECLRSFRVAEYAIFDFVLSFVLVFFLAPQGHYFIKILMIGLLFAGLKGIKRV